MGLRLLYILDVAVDNPVANTVQVLSMCQAFSRAGADLTLAIPQMGSNYSDDELKKIVRQKMGVYPQFEVASFPMRTPFGRFKLLGSYFPVRALLRRLRPDLVFLRNMVLIHAAIGSGTPFVYEAHNSLLQNDVRLLNAMWTRYVVRASKHPLMRSFVAISGALAQFWIAKGIPEHKVLALHDAVDPEKFATPLSSEAARKQLGLPLQKKLVVYAGSLYQDRGIEDIVHIASQLGTVEFVIVGGPEAGVERYRSLAASQGVSNIRFVGHVAHREVATYLFAADVLLMTWSRAVKTIDYCSPLKLFEYMAAGRTIVGHGFPTIREVLVDGEDAYLTDPDSRDELLDRLRLALEENRSDLGERARAKVMRDYTWDRRAQRILAVLD